MRRHVVGKPLPEVVDARPATIRLCNAGASKLQQRAPGPVQGGKVVFVLGIELTGGLRLIAAQQTVDTHDRSVTGIIDKQEMIEERIEAVALQPCRMIDHRSVTAKLGDENLVAQPLRGAQVMLGGAEFDTEIRGGGGHRPRLCALVWASPRF